MRLPQHCRCALDDHNRNSVGQVPRDPCLLHFGNLFECGLHSCQRYFQNRRAARNAKRFFQCFFICHFAPLKRYFLHTEADICRKCEEAFAPGRQMLRRARAHHAIGCKQGVKRE